MKTLFATAIGTATLLATGAAYAAKAAPEGYGSAWLPLLFIVVVFSLVMWVLSQMARECLEGQEEKSHFDSMRIASRDYSARVAVTERKEWRRRIPMRRRGAAKEMRTRYEHLEG